MQVEFRRVDWEYRSVFRISYRARTHAETLVVELRDGDARGRGEAMCVSYRGETPESLLEQVAAVAKDLSQGLTRAELQTRMPQGGARNAVDCALWDLEAKRAGRRAWELAGFRQVKAIQSDFTLSLDAPQAMAKAAATARDIPILKIKLGGDGDVERVAAIRAARPDATLIVDANQAWSEHQLREFVPQLAELGVKLIEQPLPVGEDDVLATFRSPIPLCADESCQTTDSLPVVRGKYQYVNIKLDKTGGLTEALRLASAARAQSFGLMVGCMGGTSLSMAPAFIIAQSCDFADLDGPLLLKADVAHGMRYEAGRLAPPEPALWG
jgi:L-alanine-DL-glutamate epimerase-like enolase superfamily enzyme